MAAWLLVLLLTATLSAAVPRDALYPYGQGLDANLPRELDDSSSPEIALRVPILFYDESYQSIYVNSNGLLSFLTEIPVFFNIQFPLDYPVIAPFYTNVDTRNSGSVYYRETQDPDLLLKATETVKKHFSTAGNFEAKSLFIATWEDVGYHDGGSDKVNTFQVIVISSGEDSFVQLVYPEGAIQWIQGSGQASGLPDARAQAGFVAADGRLRALRGSGTDQIHNLDKWSNQGVPGLWLLHVGKTGPDGNVAPPDRNAAGAGVEQVQTCVHGTTICHSKSRCVDHASGFCCVCKSGYYGNGLTCLKDGIPLRVNGKVSGKVNGEEFSQLDLQSYVVTLDGRTYTAISRVPTSIGYDLQTLNIFGGVIGWLFARPVGKVMNGYELTGGVFNHTAIIDFPLTGNKVELRQKYLGLDVFDQLKMEAEIQGEIPAIPAGSKIQIPDFEGHYTRTEPGLLLSKASLLYRLEGNPVDNPYSIEETIQYIECPHDPLNVSSFRLKVARSFISYESRESIIRYGMTNKVTPPGEFDPCRDGKAKCGEHSSCRVEGDSFRCVCNRGYQPLFTGSDGQQREVCVDVNECTTGIGDCSTNAECANYEGGYACHCLAGYSGDGHTCQKLDPCSELQCHPNAECIQDHTGTHQCRCLEGYTGDGFECAPETPRDTCDVAGDCSPYGACTLDDETVSYVCVCLPGYVGDGYNCIDSALYNGTGDTPIPSCVLGVCWCPSGYDLHGQECVKSDYHDPVIDNELSRPEPACYNSTFCFCPRGYTFSQHTRSCDLLPGAHAQSHGTMGPSGHKLSCNEISNCHPYAQCVFNMKTSRYDCQCNAGYEGDGYDCAEIDVSCKEVDICDIHASCVSDSSSGRSVCQCNAGYQGDGIICNIADECSAPEDCGSSGDCVWRAESQHYECVCRENFVKEDGLCVPDPDAGCDVANNCDAKARCELDEETGEHRCVCDRGYSGDGFSCSLDQISCNVLNNCGRGADCLYDKQAGGYRCRCRQGFHGDGHTCIPDYSCQQDPSLCSRDASCVPSPAGFYTCECNQGFIGDGAQCKAVPKYDNNFLLVSQGMAVVRVPFKPKGREISRPISLVYFQMAIGIDIDCLGGRVYWSDITGSSIKSANYDGSNFTTFIDTAGGSSEGVSVDWVSGNLYWTDSTRDILEVVNLHSKLRKVLVSGGLVNPRGVAVHPSRGKVFWSDWNREAPKLEWANQDGSERAVFLQGPSVQLPNSIAIDFDTDELCWADAGTKSIACIGISNSVERVVVTNCSYPFGLTISGSHYYWTDWNSGKIESAERPSGKRAKAVGGITGGTGKLYGIVAVPEYCPRLSNDCQFDNGGCSSGHLCLPSGPNSRSCVCAEVGSTDTEGSGEAPICNDI